jgi:hypothetical protein
LQVSARRRFSRNLTLSLAYTWSKALTTASDDQELSNPFDTRSYDYRLAAFDRTHVFSASYVYSLPKLSPYLGDNGFVKAIFDDWQISGITQFSSGPPFELLEVGSGANRTLLGSSDAGAPLFYLRGDPLSAPEGLQINPAAFFLPAPGQLDPWPRTFLRAPGINNWDISIFKNFQIRNDVYLQLRLEMFNAFNHTQFASINGRGFTPSILADDPYVEFPTRVGVYRNYLSGRRQFIPLSELSETERKRLTGAIFGRLFGERSSARDPRIIQLAAKLYF